MPIILGPDDAKSFTFPTAVEDCAANRETFVGELGLIDKVPGNNTMGLAVIDPFTDILDGSGKDFVLLGIICKHSLLNVLQIGYLSTCEII